MPRSERKLTAIRPDINDRSAGIELPEHRKMLNTRCH